MTQLLPKGCATASPLRTAWGIMYGPGPVVHVERGLDRRQIDVGFPIGIDRAHVAPVGFLGGAAHDATVAKGMRHRLAAAYGMGDDVLAEIVTRGGIGEVACQGVI